MTPGKYSQSSSSHSSSVGSTPSPSVNHGAFSSSSTPSSAVSFPSQFGQMNTGRAFSSMGRPLSERFEAARNTATVAAGKDDGDTVSAGPKKQDQVPIPPTTSDLFKIDTTNINSAGRSALMMEQRIASQLLADTQPEGKEWESFEPLRAGRIRYDPIGSHIPVFSRTLPHIVWMEAKPPAREGVDDVKVVMLPYWTTRTPADNSCVASSLSLAFAPSALTDIKRDPATFLAADHQAEHARIIKFREDCGAWMDKALQEREDRTQAFLKLCNALSLNSRPVAELKEEEKDEFDRKFKARRAEIAGTAAATVADFADLVGFMQGVFVLQCTYRSEGDSDLSSFRADCDFPQGLVTSGGAGRISMPNLSAENRVPPLFVDSESTTRVLALLHYYRHPQEKAKVEPAPVQTAEGLEKASKGLFDLIPGVGHCEPLFAATNFMLASVSNPFFRGAEIARWSPMVHMANCRRPNQVGRPFPESSYNEGRCPPIHEIQDRSCVFRPPCSTRSAPGSP